MFFERRKTHGIDLKEHNLVNKDFEYFSFLLKLKLLHSTNQPTTTITNKVGCLAQVSLVSNQDLNSSRSSVAGPRKETPLPSFSFFRMITVLGLGYLPPSTGSFSNHNNGRVSDVKDLCGYIGLPYKIQEHLPHFKFLNCDHPMKPLWSWGMTNSQFLGMRWDIFGGAITPLTTMLMTVICGVDVSANSEPSAWQGLSHLNPS